MNQNNQHLILPPELLKQISSDRKVRRALASESHLMFFNIYFADQVEYETADFQREMFSLTENLSNKSIFIEAFRGSAKSTIMNTSLLLWSVLGKPNCKFIVIVCQTQDQAKAHLKNVRMQIEGNKLLRSDLGPFQEEEDEWKSQALVIPNYGTRIMAVSADQAVRGFKYGKHRPDLIIADDLENSASVKTLDGRNKTYNLLTKEIIPAGSPKTRLVVIGNLLHDDGLLRRLEKDIREDRRDGIYRRYPLIDSQNNILWPGKYPNEEAIKKQRKQIGNDIAWQQEYLLNFSDYSDRVIHREWVKYYDRLPDIKDSKTQFRFPAFAVDPAISEKQTADYTAMVGAVVCGWGENFRIYILPFPVNERMDHPKTVRKIQELYTTLVPDFKPRIYIEDVGYQAALPQRLKQEEGLPVEAVKIYGMDKRARLALISSYIMNGTVVFPIRGAEELIQQIVGFGNEKHDDLVDAFTLLITKITEGYNKRRSCLSDCGGPDEDGGTITGGLMDMVF